MKIARLATYPRADHHFSGIHYQVPSRREKCCSQRTEENVRSTHRILHRNMLESGLRIRSMFSFLFFIRIVYLYDNVLLLARDHVGLALGTFSISCSSRRTLIICPCYRPGGSIGPGGRGSYVRRTFHGSSSSRLSPFNRAHLTYVLTAV